MNRHIIILGITLFSFIISGCCAKEVVVYKGLTPPAPKVEICTLPPCKAAIWVPGYWQWRARRRAYVWIPGHWRRP